MMSEVFGLAIHNVASFSWEILKILPPLLLLMSLLDAWVPRNFIEGKLGQDSGMQGMLFALLLGTTAAGPLFAAFPVALSLSRKGASTANVVVFLGAWSTLKLPMLLLESRFLGWEFTFWRIALTTPLVALIGVLVGRLSPLKNGETYSAT